MDRKKYFLKLPSRSRHRINTEHRTSRHCQHAIQDTRGKLQEKYFLEPQSRSHPRINQDTSIERPDKFRGRSSAKICEERTRHSRGSTLLRLCTSSGVRASPFRLQPTWVDECCKRTLGTFMQDLRWRSELFGARGFYHRAVNVAQGRLLCRRFRRVSGC